MSRDEPVGPRRRRPRASRGRSLVGERYAVEVGPVAHGGHFVARHEGRVIFVRHALPEEHVVVEVTEGDDGSKFLRADAVEVLSASPDRVTPPCPFSGPGRCGGCDFQHVDLGAQRALKAAVVREQLQRLARLDREVVVEPVPGDHDGLDWRTRVQFAVGPDGRAGLRRHRSHEIEYVDRCRIAHPDLPSVTDGTWPDADGVEAIVSTTGEQLLVRRSHGGPSMDGPQVLHEAAAGRGFEVSGSGFWQVHPGAADVLVSAVLDALQPRPGERALDLYSGVGLFSAFLAERVGAEGVVVAVESDAVAVADAERNLAGFAQVDPVVARVERALAPRMPDPVPDRAVDDGVPADPATADGVATDGVTTHGVLGRGALAHGALGERFDVVVLDPPRVGAKREVVEAVIGLAPRAVAYVACDPGALARDVAIFAEHGYRLESLRAFDIFPMTSHVECVAHLVKR